MRLNPSLKFDDNSVLSEGQNKLKDNSGNGLEQYRIRRRFYSHQRGQSSKSDGQKSILRKPTLKPNNLHYSDQNTIKIDPQNFD
jgi:hypothetical protein